MGGFSFPECRVRARPAIVVVVRRALFFDGFGMPLVARDDVDLVTLDRAFELWLRFEINYAGAQVDRHLMDIILVQIEFLRNLLVREIEPEQVPADDPFAQRLVMRREDGQRQIIKVTVTGVAMITLALALALMQPASLDVFSFTPDASDPFRPAHLSYTLVAFRVVYQVVDLEHIQSMPFSISFSKNRGAGQKC